MMRNLKNNKQGGSGSKAWVPSGTQNLPSKKDTAAAVINAKKLFY
jgi:hypothetical protein